MAELTGTNKERYDKNIRRREKLTGYYFDMSKLVFAATVLTNTDLLKGDGDITNIITVIVGLFATMFFAYFGNKILKF